MATGTVKRWVDERGFGFISKSDGGDIFAHCRDIAGSEQSLKVGQFVTFDESTDNRTGKPCAVNIRMA